MHDLQILNFLGMTELFFRVGVFRSMAFHCKILKCPDILIERRGIMYVSENIWSWKG
jgi:hypothetical protein